MKVVHGLIAICIVCAWFMQCSATSAHHDSEFENLVEMLKPFEYLHNEMNTPADKLFYNVPLTSHDKAMLSKSLGGQDVDHVMSNMVSELLDSTSDTAQFGTSFLETSSTVGSGACPGLVSELCKPCSNFEAHLNSDYCDKWTSICEKFFCDPLCRRNLWSIEIEASGDEEFVSQISAPDVKEKLQGYFKEVGCSEILGCCTPTPGNNPMELFAYNGQYPKLGTVKKCREAGDRDKAKALCDGNVQVKVNVHPEICAQYSGHEANPSIKSAFQRAGLESEDSSNGSAQKRCKQLAEQIESSKGDLEAKFNEIVCPCAGCDDHKNCPNSLAFDVLPVSYQEFEGHNYVDFILQPDKQ